MTDQSGEPRLRVIDRTAQAERKWLDDHAEARAEEWQTRKRVFARERKQQRTEIESTLELHRLALERAGRLSTVPAGNVEMSRGGGDSAGPPAQQTLEDDPRYLEHLRVIRSRLERVHELIDEAEGVAPQAVTMDSGDKNLLILKEGRGLSCEAVVDLLGRDVAGSARTVWRIRKHTQIRDPEDQRKALGFLYPPVRTSDGEPVENAGELASRPGVRRVRIQ